MHESGRLTGMMFEKVRGDARREGPAPADPDRRARQVFECDDVLVAVGQENAFPWIERNAGIDFDEVGHARSSTR